MRAVFKRELGAYFKTIIGFVFLAAYYFFSGLYFYQYVLLSQVADLSGVFQAMFSMALFIIPLLTMRLISDDKRQKTDQALFTAPVSLTSVVMGKYFAGLTVYSLGLAINLVLVTVLSFLGSPDWIVFFSNLLGAFLLGVAFIAIGVFISSLTESQVVAAISTFALSLILILLDSISSSVSSSFLQKLVSWISFNSRYNPFTRGIINYSSIVFFISIAAVFLFLTVRVLDRKRWS